MTREEAYYERIKILLGDIDSYEEWLNFFIEQEQPLSDVVLELLDCRDVNEILRVLNLYCLQKPFDEDSVYTRLRSELCSFYEKEQLTTDQVMSMLFCITKIIPDCIFRNCCLTLSDYYCLVDERVADPDRFDAVLGKWLKDGGGILPIKHILS